MSKGKQKGFKKKQIEIRDESMAPYYLIKEDKQYANALSSISKDVLLEQEAGQIFNLKRFMERSEEVNNQIINAVHA